MKHELKLTVPIKINDKKVTELSYDFDELDGEAFLRASDNSVAKMKTGRAGAYEVDYGLHLYLGYEAVLAVNENYDIHDLERLKGFDVIALQRIGRNFISGKLEELLQDDDSEPSTELTPESFQLPSVTLEEDPSENL
jgi:hypothetical protein